MRPTNRLASVFAAAVLVVPIAACKFDGGAAAGLETAAMSPSSTVSTFHDLQRRPTARGFVLVPDDTEHHDGDTHRVQLDLGCPAGREGWFSVTNDTPGHEQLSVTTLVTRPDGGESSTTHTFVTQPTPAEVRDLRLCR